MDEPALSAVLKEMRADASFDESLDYDSLRNSLAAHLRKHLEQQGQTADDEIIESYVDTYFQKRFRFVQPAMSTPAKILSMVYLHRRYLLIIPAILVLAVILRVMTWQPSTGNRETVVMQWSSLKIKNHANCEGLFYAAPLCQGYLNQINEAITAGDRILNGFDGKKPELLESAIDKQKSIIFTATDSITFTKEVDSFFHQLNSSRDFQNDLKTFEVLRQAANDVNTALSSQLDPRLPYENLKRVQGLVDTAKAQQQTVRNYLAQLSRLRLSNADMITVQAQANAALAAISGLDAANAEKSIAELTYMLKLASNAMDLRVVKSGELPLIITVDEGLQVLTYLIVEARNADGSLTDIKITDRRTGTSTIKNTFGIRIPQEVYEAALTGKLADVVAQKPRGRLQFAYRIDTLGDTITEW